MPHIMQALVENGVIDLLGHIEVQHKLMVQFPGAPLLEPGQAFLPGPTPAPPLIFTEFDVSKSSFDRAGPSKLQKF